MFFLRKSFSLADKLTIIRTSMTSLTFKRPKSHKGGHTHIQRSSFWSLRTHPIYTDDTWHLDFNILELSFCYKYYWTQATWRLTSFCWEKYFEKYSVQSGQKKLVKFFKTHVSCCLQTLIHNTEAVRSWAATLKQSYCMLTCVSVANPRQTNSWLLCGFSSSKN